MLVDEKNQLWVKGIVRSVRKLRERLSCESHCHGEPSGDDGEKRWKTNPENSYKRWREQGADCGICLASCPLSKSVSEVLIDNMKESEEARKEILEQFHAEYHNRAYNKEQISWWIDRKKSKLKFPVSLWRVWNIGSSDEFKQ